MSIFYKIIKLFVIISLLNSCALYKKRPTTSKEYQECMPNVNQFDDHRTKGNKYILNPNDAKQKLAGRCLPEDSIFFNTAECVQYRDDWKEYRERHDKQCKSTSFRDQNILFFGPVETPFLIVGGAAFLVFIIPFCLITKCYEQ